MATLDDLRKAHSWAKDWSDSDLLAYRAEYTGGTFEDVAREFGRPVNTSATQDGLSSVKQGVQELPGMFTSVVDLPFAAALGRRPFSSMADALGEKSGFTPGKWVKEAEAFKSPAYHEGAQAIDEAWSDKNTSAADVASAYLKNPAYTLNSILRSAPSMVAGGVASRGLMALGGVAGTAGAKAGLLASTFGSRAPYVAAGAGEGLVTAGQQLSNYDMDLPDQQRVALASLAAGAGTGVIGYAGGRVAKRLGVDDLHVLMAGGKSASASGAKGLVAKTAGGMVSEGLLEELPQSMQEQMWQNVGEGKPAMEGVLRQGVEGALAGASMGGAVNMNPMMLVGKKKISSSPLDGANPVTTVNTENTGNPEGELENKVASLIDFGERRMAELNAKAKGSEDFVSEDADGRAHIIPGSPAQELTAQEKEELSFLQKNAIDPAALADYYEKKEPSVSVAQNSETKQTPRYEVTKSLTATNRVSDINAQLSSKMRGLEESRDDAERAVKQAEINALIGEKSRITKSWPTSVVGKETAFSTEAGTHIKATYALMEANDLIASHDENLRATPKYPAELQPRDRERAASEIQVATLVQKLDPARLGLSADAATGAPIVGADGLVESGNARTIALKRVYQQADGNVTSQGTKARSYREFLKNNAVQFGLSPESIDGLQKPVLVRVRNTPVDRAEFARQANASTVAQMSSSETAKADAARIDEMDDLNPDANGNFATSRDFVRRFIAKLPSTETASMMDASGKLSQNGYARIRNAVLAKAYGDSPVLSRIVESMDDNMRNVGKALISAAPAVAKARQAVSEGLLFDADMTPDLMSAVEELSRIKDDGGSVNDALAQMGLFGDRYSPETSELLQFLADNLRRPRKIADFIQRYMDALTAAGNPNQGSLLGDVNPPTKAELINYARGKTNERDTESTEHETAREPTGNTSAGDEGGIRPKDKEGDSSRAQSDEDVNRESADRDLAEGLADFGAFVRQNMSGARMFTPEEKARLMPTLVKIFDAFAR